MTLNQKNKTNKENRHDFKSKKRNSGNEDRQRR